MKHKIIVLMRKFKAFVTGKKPCSFETKHGHNFVMITDFKQTDGFKYAIFRCSECKLKAGYNTFFGSLETI